MPTLTIRGRAATLRALCRVLDAMPGAADFAWTDRGLYHGGPQHRWYDPEAPAGRRWRYQVRQPLTGHGPRPSKAARRVEQGKGTLADALAAHGLDRLDADGVQALAKALSEDYTVAELRALGKEMGWRAGAGTLPQLALDIVAQAREGAHPQPLYELSADGKEDFAAQSGAEGKNKEPWQQTASEWHAARLADYPDLAPKPPASTYDRARVERLGFAPSDLATLERLGKANGVTDLEAAARAAVGIAHYERRVMTADDIQRGVDRVKIADAEGHGKPDGVYTDLLGRRYRMEGGKRVAVGEEISPSPLDNAEKGDTIPSDSHRTVTTEEKKMDVEHLLAGDLTDGAQRGIAADALEEAGRAGEAKLLRGPQVVAMTEGGAVVPAEDAAAARKHGREARPGPVIGGSTKGERRRAGEVFRSKKWGGMYVVTESSALRHVSSDWIEDNDDWARYPDGPGRYSTWKAVPVVETAGERSEREAAEAAKSEEAAAKKASRSAAARGRKADPLVTVTGNTYAVKDRIKAIPGARWDVARRAWRVPLSQVSRLPRGTSHEAD